MTLTKALLPATLISIALVGCGGDSSSSSADTSGVIERLQYTGNDEAAVLSASNKDAFVDALSAAIPVYSEVDDVDIDFIDPFSLGSNVGPSAASAGVDELLSVLPQAGVTSFAVVEVPSEETEEVAEIPEKIVEQGSCGGSYTINLDVAAIKELQEQDGPDPQLATSMVFDQYCTGSTAPADGTTINGTVNFVNTLGFDESDELNAIASVVTFRSLTVSEEGISVSLSGVVEKKATSDDADRDYYSISATADGKTYVFAGLAECSNVRKSCVDSQYVKAAGSTFRIDNGSFDLYNEVYYKRVDEQPLPQEEQYRFTGTFFHPVYGSVAVEATQLTFCEAGGIDGGYMTLTDSQNNEVEVEFDSCGLQGSVEFIPAPVIEQPPLEEQPR